MTDIREQVSQAYTKAVARSKAKQSSCCAPSCCEPAEGVAARFAGYSAEERAGFAEAAQSSFGCGNPLAMVDVKQGETVLDLGSGAGLDLLIAAAKVGPSGKVIGVDMTDAMIAAARENVAKAGVAEIVEIRKGHIEDLPVETSSVDWVISNCVINLSPDKPKVFAEIARVLRPGGRFSVSDIVAEGLPDWIVQNAAAYSACIAGAVSEADYLGGLREAGLVDVEVTERFVYEADQLHGIVASDLENLGLDASLLERGINEAVGKVWSAKVVGRKP